MSRALAVLALAVAAACGRTPPAAAPAQSQRALRKVASEAVAALERELGPAPQIPAPDAELGEHVDGLVETLAASDESLRRLARTELLGLGPAAVSRVAAFLADAGAPQARRTAAAQALAAFDTPPAAEALLARIELARKQVDPETWMRAHCAWRLGETTQDWIVPRLLLHLRYETDHETVIWMAATLAHFGNFAGLDGLQVIARTATTQELRDSAAATLARLAAEHGCASAEELQRAWYDGDPGRKLPDAELSPRHRLEIWRTVAGFKEWQLRGVDDGRFALTREHPRIAALLGEALADEDRYVRTHAAQCLERLGRRGSGACAALLAALPDAEIAGQVLLALGSVGCEPAQGAMAERLAASQPLELRVAAAKALGRLRLASSVAALDPLTAEGVPLDLRVSAACARIECSPADAPRALLELALKHMTSGEVESAGPEIALDAWLADAATRSPEAGRKLWDEWRATLPEDPAERVKARAALVAAQLDAFAPPR